MLSTSRTRFTHVEFDHVKKTYENFSLKSLSTSSEDRDSLLPFSESFVSLFDAFKQHPPITRHSTDQRGQSSLYLNLGKKLASPMEDAIGSSPGMASSTASKNINALCDSKKQWYVRKSDLRSVP